MRKRQLHSTGKKARAVLDVTERKHAEEVLRDREALRRSEAWLAQAQRLSHTGNWVMDGPTRRFLYWSDESYRIWRFDPLQGLPSREDMWGRVHPDDRERVWEEVQEALREKIKMFFLAFKILPPDGTVKYLEANIQHEYSALGELLETFCTTVDVTERKRAQEEHEKLRKLQSDLTHINRVNMMGELAASLSHEMNQPITAVIGNAHAAKNWLGHEPPDLEQVQNSLGKIINDAKRAGDVIGRIRALIKKVPPQKDRLEINEAIREVVELTSGETVKNGVSLRTEFANSLPLVNADRVQLQQVVLNLIINSTEAMSFNEGARDLLISTGKAESGGVLVAVRDSGPGIDPARLERVFDAFYTTKSRGMGMGLSICRSIVDDHGGRLWAAANQPRGTMFQFTLPCAENQP